MARRLELPACDRTGETLDWTPGTFFDADGLLLICSTHGAVYAPDAGRCLGGPCFDGGLVRLAVEERDGTIYLKEKNDG